jgi:uracil-DNA glycosylase family protein
MGMADEEERPGAQRWVPERASLDELREAAQACRGCELYRDATQVVMGRGAEGARLVLLGEQPGDQEDKQGEPFVGPAGRLLVRALDDAGIDRAGTYSTNVVKHFRWRSRGKQRIHQTPNQAHVTACGPWLVAEFRELQPSGVVLLGGTAGKLVFGSTVRVGEARGRLVDWPDRLPVQNPPDWVRPTTHPSAVLRAEDRDAVYDGLVADLRVAAEALSGA